MVRERDGYWLYLRIRTGTETGTGQFSKSSMGTERRRVVFKSELRVSNVEGFFSKRWCVNGTGTDVFQKLSTGTGFSTEVVRNKQNIILYET